MARKRIQFSFFMEKSDGGLMASAYDSIIQKRFTFCFTPNGDVHRIDESSVFGRWQSLPVEEADAIRLEATTSFGRLPSYRW